MGVTPMVTNKETHEGLWILDGETTNNMI
jgi:hypothetical protein